MPKYKIEFSRGSSAATKDGQTFLGSPASISVDAQDRIDAYIMAYQFFLEKNEDVTIIEYVESQKFPLGFSAEEVERVRLANIPINLGYPKLGVQIESITAEDVL